MPTFVLVHGAFQGAWVYARLAKRLRSAGHDVYAPTLTGLGERSHLLDVTIDLDMHVQDVVNVLVYEDLRDVFLCGHSYGGMVITGVANAVPDRVRSLIYIDAYVPADGQSMCDIQGPGAVETWTAMARDNNGYVPPIPAAGFNVNAHDEAWVDALSGSQPLGTFTQPVRGGIEAPALTDMGRSFVYASANGGDWFAGTRQKLADHPAWKVHDIACGHNIMLDRTDELASLMSSEVYTNPR